MGSAEDTEVPSFCPKPDKRAIVCHTAALSPPGDDSVQACQ